jgi:ectoine hydroxylase-related dioxygenase (phytanoyl-CoA dioxygenase family)
MKKWAHRAQPASVERTCVRFTVDEHDALARDFNRDSIVVLRNHFDPAVLRRWSREFAPLLEAHMVAERDNPNRGSQRFYVTLPFSGTFADPAIYEDDDVLAIVERVAGPDPVMCQLATDTPLKGSDYQAWHADTPLLFPETDDNDTPSFQIAVNFPLVDVTDAHGPLETTHGTHRMRKELAMQKLAAGELAVHRLTMALGDVMIRDVRAVHRGTPNVTDEARPMVVIGYSRRWLHRPEVNIRVPRSVHETMSERGKRLVRFNPVVDDAEAVTSRETYRNFAY